MSLAMPNNDHEEAAKVAELRAAHGACRDCLNLLKMVMRSASFLATNPPTAAQIETVNKLQTNITTILAAWDGLSDNGAAVANQIMQQIAALSDPESNPQQRRIPSSSQLRDLINRTSSVYHGTQRLKISFQSALDDLTAVINNLTQRRSDLYRALTSPQATKNSKKFKPQSKALVSLTKSSTLTTTLLLPNKLLNVGVTRGFASLLTFSQPIVSAVTAKAITKSVDEYEKMKRIEETIELIDRILGFLTTGRGHLDRTKRTTDIIINQWAALVQCLERILQTAGRHERQGSNAVKRAGSVCRVYARASNAPGAGVGKERAKARERFGTESREEYAIWMWVGAMRALEGTGAM